MAKNDQKNKLTPGKLIIAIIFLALMELELLGPILVLTLPIGICWLVFRSLRKRDHRSEKGNPRQPLDDCPKPICFHKDKGIHHVRRGRGQDPWDLPNREIDPWDRPDIDIRKYQRR